MDKGEADWPPIWPEVRDCRSDAVAWRLAGRRGAWGPPEAAWRRGGWEPTEGWRFGRRGG